MNTPDTFYLAYFLLHIPITILIDSNIVVPEQYALGISKSILDFHVQMNKDVLFMGPRPVWFMVFGAFELVFQLPLFFYCSYHLYWQTKKHYVWMVIYGFNASFTTLVCLVYAYSVGADFGLTTAETLKLLSVYVPYLVIPFYIMVDYAVRIDRAFSTLAKKID